MTPCIQGYCSLVPEVAGLVGHDRIGHRICRVMHLEGVSTRAELEAFTDKQLYDLHGIGRDAFTRIRDRLAATRPQGDPPMAHDALAAMEAALTANVRDGLATEFPDWRIELESSGRWSAYRAQWGTLYGQSAAELRERIRSMTSVRAVQNAPPIRNPLPGWANAG